MAYEVLVVVIVFLCGFAVWKMRGSKESDNDFQKRVGEYNRECRLIKIDYRNGLCTPEEVRKRLEEIGDRHRIPTARRTRSLGAVQLRRE